MASRKENLTNLFRNTRTRVIVIMTVFALVLTAALGFIAIKHRLGGQEETTISSQTAQRIQSIPGAAKPSEEYSLLVEKANLERAQQAQQTGKSAIPTIVRTETVGQGGARIRPEDTAEGVGFSSLAREGRETAGSPGLWYDNLRATNCSKKALEEAIGSGGTVGQFKRAGCSPEQLIAEDFSIAALKAGGFNAKELRAAGYNARDLKAAGFDAAALREAGYSACELKAAGYSIDDMRKAGYTDGELKGAGFSDDEIRKAAGLPTGLTPEQIQRAGCSSDAINREKALGVSAKQIKENAGCSASALLAGGFGPQDLLNANFTPRDLRESGITCEAMKEAGSSATELYQSGACSEDALKNAGFSADEIEKALQAKLPGGYTADSLKALGCDPTALGKARAAGVSASDIRRISNCSLSQLKAAGYTAQELKAAGYSPKELKDAGFSAADLKAAGFSAKELKDAGFGAKDLKDAGYSPSEMISAGYTPKDLKDAGYTVKEMLDNGVKPKDILASGYTAKDLSDAGVSLKDMKDSGLTCQALKDAGISAASLKETGVCDLAALKAAGFTAEDLLGAGYTEAELKAAGIAIPPKPTVSAVSDKQLQSMLAQEQARNGQRLQQEITQRKSKMSTTAKQIVASWAAPAQTYVTGTPPEEEKKGSGEAAPAAPGAPQAQMYNGVALNNTNSYAIQAGTILFGALETSVNSDEPGPVLATIVSGRLKGARLIGSLQKPKDANSVILTFNLMSVRGVDSSVSIQAVAVNESTARTGLATKVDKHALSRYGSLFAASFLEGYGSAIQQVGTSISTNNSSTTISQASRSAGENVLVALGTVGQRWGEQVEKNFDRPNTVYVSSGTSMGILFTQDVRVPLALGLNG